MVKLGSVNNRFRNGVCQLIGGSQNCGDVFMGTQRRRYSLLSHSYLVSHTLRPYCTVKQLVLLSIHMGIAHTAMVGRWSPKNTSACISTQICLYVLYKEGSFCDLHRDEGHNLGKVISDISAGICW